MESYFKGDGEGEMHLIFNDFFLSVLLSSLLQKPASSFYHQVGVLDFQPTRKWSVQCFIIVCENTRKPKYRLNKQLRLEKQIYLRAFAK